MCVSKLRIERHCSFRRLSRKAIAFVDRNLSGTAGLRRVGLSETHPGERIVRIALNCSLEMHERRIEGFARAPVEMILTLQIVVVGLVRDA